MPNINWFKYSQISKGKGVELIGWLYSLDITDNGDIVSVLNATNGLDGAMTEGYSGVVAKLFTADTSGIPFITLARATCKKAWAGENSVTWPATASCR